MLRIRVDDSDPEGFAEALDDALSSVRTRRIMARAESMIKRRTARGEFLAGSSPGAGSYSTEPYAQPAGSLTDQVRDSLPDDEVSYFTTSDDDLWLVIEGGYEAVRRAKGLPTSTVDLQVTGGMLEGMRSTAERSGQDQRLEMLVGYIDGASPQEAIQLARYHNVEGAGPNQVKRVFVGLTDDEADTLEQDLEQDIRRGL